MSVIDTVPRFLWLFHVFDLNNVKYEQHKSVKVHMTFITASTIRTEDNETPSITRLIIFHAYFRELVPDFGLNYNKNSG